MKVTRILMAGMLVFGMVVPASAQDEFGMPLIPTPYGNESQFPSPAGHASQASSQDQELGQGFSASDAPDFAPSSSGGGVSGGGGPLEHRRQALKRFNQRRGKRSGKRDFKQLRTPILIGEPGMSRDPNIRKVQLELRGLDIGEAFKILSKTTGISIVTGSKVKGKVSMYLKGVDAWEAFEAIVESNGLSYVRRGDVIQVIPAGDFEKLYGVKPGAARRIVTLPLEYARPSEVLEVLDRLKTQQGEVVVSGGTLLLIDTPEGLAAMKEAIATLDKPLPATTFILNYAKVEEIMELIPPSDDPLEGSVKADIRTNRLLVRGSLRRIRDIGKIIKAFDIPHQVVMIEAKIVQVGLDDNNQLGIDWDVFRGDIGSSVQGTARIVSKLQFLPVGSQSVADATNKGTVATLTKLAPTSLTAAIKLLKTIGKTDILSSPRITTLNGHEAKILVGTREPYVTTTVVNPGGGSPTTTSEQVTFVDVGVKLFVTPTIGEDGSITMKVKPEVSSVNMTLTTAAGNTIPIVRTSQAETTVMVQNGSVVVIGGLIENRKETSENRIPILGRIPLLGFFFRSRAEYLRKSEIVIFLTPKIVNGRGEFKEVKAR